MQAPNRDVTYLFLTERQKVLRPLNRDNVRLLHRMLINDVRVQEQKVADERRKLQAQEQRKADNDAHDNKLRQNLSAQRDDSRRFK